MNRRQLLIRVAAIAGAATLAGGKTAEAAEANAIGQQIPGPSTRVRYDGDTDLSQRCVGCGWEGEWWNETPTLETAARSVAEFEQHIQQEHDGVEQYRDGIWRPHDPLKTSQRIREARAEGYERAEFVKAKREESRGEQEPTSGYLLSLQTQSFEAMQADCEARGCELTGAAYPFEDRSVYWHSGEFGPAFHWPTSDPHILGRVDAWRRSLHDEESRASIGNAQGDTLMVVGSTTIVGNLNVVGCTVTYDGKTYELPYFTNG